MVSTGPQPPESSRIPPGTSLPYPHDNHTVTERPDPQSSRVVPGPRAPGWSPGLSHSPLPEARFKHPLGQAAALCSRGRPPRPRGVSVTTGTGTHRQHGPLAQPRCRSPARRQSRTGVASFRDVCITQDKGRKTPGLGSPGLSRRLAGPLGDGVRSGAHLFSCSKQGSHTRTSFSMPNLGMVEDLEEHLPQKIWPHARQWCCDEGSQGVASSGPPPLGPPCPARLREHRKSNLKERLAGTVQEWC